MRKNKILFSFIILLLFTGCATSVGYINDGLDKYPPTNINEIKIYSEKVTEMDYIEIGYVSANITDNASGDKLKALILNEASKMGADAVISFQIWSNTAEGIAIKYNK